MPGLVDEAGEPEPHQHAAPAQLRLFAAQAGVVGALQELVEQRRRIAGIVDAAAGRRIGEVVLADEIAPPDLDHVDAERMRAQLQQASR